MLSVAKFINDDINKNTPTYSKTFATDSIYGALSNGVTGQTFSNFVTNYTDISKGSCTSYIHSKINSNYVVPSNGTYMCYYMGKSSSGSFVSYLGKRILAGGSSIWNGLVYNIQVNSLHVILVRIK